jgi:BirA family biotin operon repressor/biotin-[acetyl-CoA-carboxylase] ligase
MTEFLGRSIVYRPSVTSTNDVAKELARHGTSEGTLVVADEQTAGRGRRGRQWIAPAGTSLLASLVFYPDDAPAPMLRQGTRLGAGASEAAASPTMTVQRVVMASGLGVLDGIAATIGVSARLKWPNDIVLDSRKLGGILAEAGFTDERIDYVVVGLGLNVNFAAASVPELAETATSLSDALGRQIERELLLAAILGAIESWYRRGQAGESLLTEWSARLVTPGQLVCVATPWGNEEGRAESVDAEGALVLRRADGTFVRITIGDVS